MCSRQVAATADGVKKVAEFIADPIADSISSTIAFVSIFVGVFIVLSILTKTVDTVFHLPVLNSVNKLFGLLFGGVEALILVIFICNAGSALILAFGSLDSSTFGQNLLDSTFIMKNVMRVFPTADLFGLI